MNIHASLLEIALADEEARHDAAIAAIRSRQADITELQRLSEALSSRGFTVRPNVSTAPVGQAAICHLRLSIACTHTELRRILEWFSAADVAVTRLNRSANGVVYQATLRGQQLQLDVKLSDRSPGRLPIAANVC